MSRLPSPVAITGLGIRCPAGNTPKDVWRTLSTARTTLARQVPEFVADGLPVTFAATVPEFDIDTYLDAREQRRTDRATALGLCAATDALSDAGPHDHPPHRIAVVSGTTFGGITSHEAAFSAGSPPGVGRPGPLHVPMLLVNAAAAMISLKHAITGPNLCVATACAAGSHAIGEASRLIRHGEADLAIAGGTEAPLTPTTVLGFDKLGALSRRITDPASASRPFDQDRDGFVLAEAAAYLVLERLDLAVARGAHIYGLITGYARTGDAHHLTAPHPEGRSVKACIRAALDDAGCTPDQITHINAHGTSTDLNDFIEAAAISEVFGPRTIPVTSTKSVIGHSLGAAGAVEAVVSTLTLAERMVHPTVNLSQLDERCPIDVVTAPRSIPSGPILSNSFGFGGHNAALVFAPQQGPWGQVL
ncbi:beta-ketoacyl-[acyl-carrier-protein] synthase family protein [Micromonospora sp. NPDC050417]|uniref:beta-ketoacyl-[acyl-carrier-protein] synthase family protein n=1 Tax=Micromonospora sp. NPDC050417 TaxID=3364280 RepID=UPI0037A5584B